MAKSATQQARGEISFGRLMGTSIAARLLVDTHSQIFNPFLSLFAAGLGTDVVTMGQLVSLRNLMGLCAPFLGVLADRQGYRRVLRLSLLLGAAGSFLIAGSYHLSMAVVGMVLSGLGIAGFIPTLQAYLSARLPYARRARGMGMLEYSWALTGIVSLSLIGWLIQEWGWRAPFWLLGVGMLAMWTVFTTLPETTGSHGHGGGRGAAVPARVGIGQRIRAFFDLGGNARSAYAAILATALTYYGALQVMITHGTWLNLEYGLGPAQLGTVALLLGFFDLTASVSVSLFTDAIGKRRSVILGTSGTLLGYLALPWLNVGLVPAILGIAVARGAFEFALVSSFPLLSEQAPDRRARVMTLNTAISLVGATLASASGPWIYTAHGVAGLAAVSALAACGALVLHLTLVRETSP
ncbi:MFS transporter [Litorilinea aerophila]|uniref:MFS transporter n=1 Tax=Litorilinea aerophila TaxID=1204385 RepID=A0A540VC22_9CHLR|nr:MFS transporter [Litorilinea aerophila]MCC9077883.1 MFS transporter [Litorilinea aerophila]